MGKVTGSLATSFRPSLEPRLLLYAALFAVIYLIGSYVLQVIIINLPLAVIFSLFFPQFASLQAAQASEATAAIASLFGAMMQNLPLLIAATVIFYCVYLIAYALLESVAFGLLFNLAKARIEGKAFSFDSLWRQAAKRYKVLFKVLVIVCFLWLAAFILLSLPIVIWALNFVAGLGQGAFMPSSSAWMSLMVYIAVALVVYCAACFFISPLLMLAIPVALFEELGAVETIKRSISLGLRHYPGNLAFLVLLCLIFIAAGLAVAFVLFILAVILILLLSIAGLMLVVLLALIAVFIFMVWAWTFTPLALTKYYLAAAGTAAHERKAKWARK